MTQVDFYVIEDNDHRGAEKFACKLTEKIYKQGYTIYIHTQDEEQSNRMDDLLWTFRQGSFIPHAKAEVISDENIKVLIGSLNQQHLIDETKGEILINLASKIPMSYQKFSRIAELVSQEHQRKASAREHYRYYRDQGCKIASHQVSR